MSALGFKPGKYDKPAGKTSAAAVSIQIANAASELGLSLEAMPFADQVAMLNCLNTDVFNLTLVAIHLRGLILHDYPGANTATLNDEQFIVAGSRYNRGMARALTDITNSRKQPEGSKSRKYSEYGRAMVSRRAHVMQLLEKQ